ncbi:hypothetical protein GQ600_9851 [Phytophthora cactorum]|nr:hypothetical protein GQ600_9851 [Phytophthora cactorum]
MAKKRSTTAKPERVADSDLSRLDTPWCRGTSWPQPAGVHARRADTSPVEFGANASAGISWRWSEVSLQGSVLLWPAVAIASTSRCLCRSSDRTALPPAARICQICQVSPELRRVQSGIQDVMRSPTFRDSFWAECDGFRPQWLTKTKSLLHLYKRLVNRKAYGGCSQVLRIKDVFSPIQRCHWLVEPFEPLPP